MNKNGRKSGAANKPRVILREPPERITRILGALKEWCYAESATVEQTAEARAATHAMINICERALYIPPKGGY